MHAPAPIPAGDTSADAAPSHTVPVRVERAHGDVPVTGRHASLAHGTVIGWEVGAKPEWVNVGSEDAPVWDIDGYKRTRFPRMYCGTCKRVSLVRSRSRCPHCHREMPSVRDPKFRQ